MSTQHRSETSEPTKPQEAVVTEEIRFRPKRDPKELRAIILQEAGALFLDLGYDQFSMRKVGARIGYSATTIYHHFQDKEALLLALLGEAFCSFRQTLDDAYASTDDPVARLAAIGLAYIRYAQNHPVYYSLMFLRRPDYLLHREQELFHGTNNGLDTLMKAVVEMQALGYYPGHSSEAVAHSLWARTHGIVALGLTVFQGKPEIFEAAIRATLQFDPKKPNEAARDQNPKTSPQGDISGDSVC